MFRLNISTVCSELRYDNSCVLRNSILTEWKGTPNAVVNEYWELSLWIYNSRPYATAKVNKVTFLPLAALS